MDCPICSEPAGFHAGRCYEYSPKAGTAGPGNSKDFMPWMRAKIKADAEAKAKAKLEAKTV